MITEQVRTVKKKEENGGNFYSGQNENSGELLGKREKSEKGLKTTSSLAIGG